MPGWLIGVRIQKPVYVFILLPIRRGAAYRFFEPGPIICRPRKLMKIILAYLRTDLNFAKPMFISLKRPYRSMPITAFEGCKMKRSSRIDWELV